MGLKLITGRSGAGKTGRLYEGVRTQAARGAAPVLLLPSAPDVHRARREFAARGDAGVRIAVLDRWTAELWGLWGDGRPLVDGASREILLSRVVDEAGASAIGASARHRGFITSLAVLARQAPDPETMEAHTRCDVEIRSILVAYRERVRARGLVEPAEAAELLAANPPQVLPPLYINRFTDLARSQERLLVGLSTATSVWAALPWEMGHEGTEVLDPLVRRLQEAGAHEHLDQPASRDELGALEATLFRTGGRVEPTGMVALGEAPDEAREVTLAIDQIRHHLDAGVEPSRIVLTFRAAERRAANVIAAAHEAAVPLHVDLRMPLSGAEMGKALFALLDTVSGRNLSRQRFAAYAQSVYSGVSPMHAAELDRSWRRSGATGERLLRSVEELGGQPCSAIQAARAVCAECGEATPRIWKTLADCMVRNASDARGLGNLRGSSDAAAHSGILSTISSLSGAWGSPSESDVQAALERSSIIVSTGDERAAVHFTEAERVRAMRYDVVVLGGLTAGEFSTQRDPSWGSAFLERVGVESENSERLRERLLFYSLVTRARGALVLLRSTGEGEGRESRPSVLWEEVVALYRSPSEDADSPSVLPVLSPGDTRSPVATAIAHTPGRRDGRAAAVAPYRPRRGCPLKGSALERLSATAEFSVTEIEAYLSCPYRWFFQKAIKPREIDRELGVREWGSAAHEILARYYRARIDRPAGRLRSEDLPDAHRSLDEICDEVFTGYAQASSVEEECGLEQVRVRVHQAIEDDVDYLPGFDPCEIEMRFGVEHGRPFEFGGVSLTGSVDRIDCSETSLVVTDYKSGSSLSGHGSFSARGYVQLPVYAAAAGSLLGKRVVGAVYRSLASRRSVRGFWLEGTPGLCGWGTRTDPVDPDGFARIVDDAAERVAAAAAGIRLGHIGITPSDASCRLCIAAPVCGSGAPR